MNISFNWNFIAEFIRLSSILFTLFLGIFVLKSNIRKHVNRIFFAGTVSISCWSLFDYLQDILYPILGHSYLYDVSLIFGVTSVISYIFLFHYFPAPVYKINKLGLVFSGLLYIFLVSQIIMKNFYLNHGANIPQTVFEPTFIGSIYLNSVSLVFLYLFGVILLKWIRQSSQTSSSQFLIVSIGLLITIIWLWVFNLSPFSYDQGQFFYHIGYSSFIALYVGVYVAIARTEAFNIKTALHQKLFWLFLNLAFLFPIFYFLSIINAHSVDYISNPFKSILFIQIMGLFLLILVYRYFIQPVLNHLFFRRRFQLKKTIHSIQESILQIQTIDRLADTVLKEISKVLYPKNCSLHFTHKHNKVLVFELNKNSNWFKKNVHINDSKNYIHRFPIESQHYTVGEISIDEKKNLKKYSANELYFLSKLGEILGRYFENAFLYDNLLTQKQHLDTKQNELITQKSDINKKQIKEDIIRKITSFISHEVKNTLYAISGSIHTIKTHPQLISDTQKKEAIFSNMEDNCYALVEYTRKYKHLDTLSKQQNNHARFNLTTIIELCMNDLRLLALQKKQTLRFTKKDIEFINSDPEKIKLLCFNILNNAVIHGEMGCLISIRYTVNTHDSFRIEIHNSHGHIPAHRLIQTDFDTLSFPEFKNGLGLFIIHSTCNDLGLACDISSTKETGTRVKIMSKD